MKLKIDLKKIPLFKDLTESTISHLENSLFLIRANKGNLLYREGERSEGLYILVGGQVGIYRTIKNKKNYLLHKVELGHSFGENSLINNTQHDNLAKIEKAAAILFLPKKDFDSIIKKDPNITLALSLALARKLSHLHNKILAKEHPTTIACFYAVENQTEKARLSIETALSLKKQTKKKVLLVDLMSGTQKLEEILKKKLNFDFILISLSAEKSPIDSALIEESDFLINFDKKSPRFDSERLTTINVDLDQEKELGRLDWFTGHLARVISKTTIGIALGSGTTGGIVHIGVLKYLNKQNIPIDMIAGCSGGAVYGTAFAFLGSADQVEKNMKKLVSSKFNKLLDFSWSRKGFSGGKRLAKIASKVIGKNATFEDMQIPIHIVATNLHKKSPKTFSKGKIWPAVRASLSLPIVFTPTKIEEEEYIDGAMTNPLPIDILKKAGMHKIIAVYASQNKEVPTKKINNFLDVYFQSRRIINDSIAFKSATQADVFINPDVSDFGTFDYHRFDELVKIGYQTAKKSFK